MKALLLQFGLIRKVALLRWCVVISIGLLLGACQFDASGLQMAEGWRHQSLGAWKNLAPNQMALSSDGRWLYFGSQTGEFAPIAGVAAMRPDRGRTHLLVQGLANVHGLRFAPDGSLWVAEGGEQGSIWRMVEAERFPDEQRVNTVTRESTHPGFAPYRFAGRFAHGAVAFSGDGRFAYLADRNDGGCLYRLTLNSRKLAVLHRSSGWLAINPDSAPRDANRLGAAQFHAIADIERMPDGTLLMAESGGGKLLQLDDRGASPTVMAWLGLDEIVRPVDLAWDRLRGWWWIADSGALPARESALWAWDGHKLHRMAWHAAAAISGVLVSDDALYLNLLRGPNNPAMTFVLSEQ